MKHISSERKTNIINRYYNGDPVAELTELRMAKSRSRIS